MADPFAGPGKDTMKRLITALALAGSLAGAASAQASSGTHWCRQGDPPIQAGARTSCAFAGQVVSRYYIYGSSDDPTRFTARVYSPVTHRTYTVSYRTTWVTRYTGSVTATGANGISARFVYDY
jgi:hypothetical protein